MKLILSCKTINAADATTRNKGQFLLQRYNITHSVLESAFVAAAMWPKRTGAEKRATRGRLTNSEANRKTIRGSAKPKSKAAPEWVHRNEPASAPSSTTPSFSSKMPSSSSLAPTDATKVAADKPKISVNGDLDNLGGKGTGSTDGSIGFAEGSTTLDGSSGSADVQRLVAQWSRSNELPKDLKFGHEDPEI